MIQKKKKIGLHHKLHQKIHHHLKKKRIHRHIHKALHVIDHFHHNFFHGIELIIITLVTLYSFGFANLTGLNQNLYRDNATEVAQELLIAIQNPTKSLQKGNLISIWNMDMDVENTFAKGYCTYGAARISPEFFPFIDNKTQQRTWGGNAVDRCNNASETGYKIGSTPVQGALVVYNAGGRFGIYGHVGKVLHYEKALKKIIVRDMAWVARGTMSDRREDLTTANVKCYIYNSKTDIIDISNTGSIIIPPVGINTGTNSISTGTIIETGTNIPATNTHNANTTPPSNNPIIIPTPTTSPVNPTTPIQEPVIIPTPVPEIVTPSVTSFTKKVQLNLDTLSDIANHFMTQNDISLTVVSKSPLKLGETSTLTIEIKDKKTSEPYSGLLPFAFTILSSNDCFQSDISTIKLISKGSLDVSLLAQKIGTASIVLLMDGTRIGEFSISAE